MWLGKNVNRKDMPCHVIWPQRPIYEVGTAFSYIGNRNLCETENLSSKINKLQKIFNIWSQPDLSLYGGILIAKIVRLSKLTYSSTCVQTPAEVSDIVNKLVVNFIWNGKKPKIKMETLIGSKDSSSLYYTHIKTKQQTCSVYKFSI